MKNLSDKSILKDLGSVTWHRLAIFEGCRNWPAVP